MQADHYIVRLNQVEAGIPPWKKEDLINRVIQVNGYVRGSATVDFESVDGSTDDAYMSTVFSVHEDKTGRKVDQERSKMHNASGGVRGKLVAIFYASRGAVVQTEQRTVSVTFCVSVPNGSEAVFLSGNLNGWNPAGLALRMTDGCVATAALDLPHGQNVEYKYTRGSWTTVEKTADQRDMPNRMIRIDAGDTGSLKITDTVQAWADFAAE